MSPARSFLSPSPDALKVTGRWREREWYLRGEKARKPDVDPKIGLSRKCASVSFVNQDVPSEPAEALGARGRGCESEWEAANSGDKGCLA